jgi:cytoskeletal protein CcmA (bactofilin family)
MFHRPKSETEQAQGETKVIDDKPKAPVEQFVQQQMPMPETQSPAPSQNFQSLKEKIFEGSKQQPQQKDSTATEDKKMSETEDQTTTQSRTPDMPTQASAFQKPGIPPRVPGAYPGSFPGAGNSVYGASAPSATPAAATEAQQRKLVVGMGITMSGEIECCDTLLVEGTVEAALKGASVLHVAETGIFYGTVEIDEATIAGRFEGDLTVNGRLTVKSTGSITGSIVYKELAIEAGAALDGKVSPLGGSKIAPRKDKKAKGHANDGSELPFTGTNG